MSTPNDIEILIHCCCIAAPHPRCDAPAVRETLEQFVADGIAIADQSGQFYGATEKGRAWLAAICNVPYPEQRWIDEHGRVLKP